MDKLELLDSQITNLSEKIELINQTVQFHFAIWYALLGIIIAIFGITFYYMIKSWVKTKVEESLPDVIDELEDRLGPIVDEHFEKRVSIITTTAGSIVNLPGKRLVTSQSDEGSYEITYNGGETRIYNKDTKDKAFSVFPNPW